MTPKQTKQALKKLPAPIVQLLLDAAASRIIRRSLARAPPAVGEKLQDELTIPSSTRSEEQTIMAKKTTVKKPSPKSPKAKPAAGKKKASAKTSK